MLKKFLSFLGIVLLLAACQSGTKNPNITVEPAKPKQGENVKIIYNPANTVLKDSKNVTLTAYQFNWEIQDAREVPMKKEGGVWTAEFPVAKDVCGIIMMFSDGDKKDNFNNKGYIVQVYDKDGNKVKGLKAGLASAYLGWISNLGIDSDGDKAYKMFREAFAEEPSVKRAYYPKYLLAVMRNDKDKKLLKKELQEFASYKDLNEEELSTLVDMFSAVRDRENFEKYKKICIEKFPKGRIAQRVKYQEMKGTPTVKDIEAFKKEFPGSSYIERLTYNALRSFALKKDFKGALKFCKQLKEDIHPYYFNYVVEKILKANGDLKIALKIAKMGIERAEEEASQPDSLKPKKMTLKDWREMNNYYLGKNYAGYATLLNKLGKKKEALEALEKTISLTKKDYLDGDIITLYARLLVDQKEYAKAKELIEEIVKEGKADTEMKELLKKAYTALNGADKGFNAYFLSLEGEANQKMIEELKSEMIDDPAPDFTLQDLNGNSVTLSDLKGKIVIVDFWATWCHPCISSFPGMKQVVEKFKNDKDVVFLFVNTWERVENKIANARQFITQNKYPFTVLMDMENKVVAAFKVQGIPTKFIIDKKGHIRFKSIGYDGSVGKLVNELSMMINMLK